MQVDPKLPLTSKSVSAPCATPIPFFVSISEVAQIDLDFPRRTPTFWIALLVPSMNYLQSLI
jgi:hypothetical protein